VPTGIAGQIANQSSLQRLSITVPSSGKLSIKVSNLRAQFHHSERYSTPVQAQLAFSSKASISIDQSQPVVAYAQTGLLATLYENGITCTGSPLPQP